MACCGLRQAISDRFFEKSEILIVMIVEAFLAHKFPEPFDEIQIGRIGRKKEYFNVQASSFVQDVLAPLVPGIIHHQGDWSLQTQCGDFFQQLAYTLRIDVGVIGDRDQLRVGGIKSS